MSGDFLCIKEQMLVHFLGHCQIKPYMVQASASCACHPGASWAKFGNYTAVPCLSMPHPNEGRGTL